jgi:trk system potassium uptake protein
LPKVHAVIAGCGRVGSQLALELTAAGNSVAIIDKDRRAFRRLGDGFSGEALHGIVFDRGILEEAGIGRAQAFVAVTNGDNSNIVSARIAAEHYEVRHVVARIYDPARALIYERFGITTIAAAQWTVDEVRRALAPPEERIEHDIGLGPSDVVLVSFLVPEGAQAVPVGRLAVPGEAVVAAVSREGGTMVPAATAVLEAGDRVHLSVQREALDRARARVAGLAKGGA